MSNASWHNQYSKIDFFKRLGIFLERDFLDNKACNLLCAEARTVKRAPATIIRSSKYCVDEHSRRTKSVILSDDTTKTVNQRLLSLKSRLEGHFGIPLRACEGANFLLYTEGDFFKPHRDVPNDDNSPTQRKISVIVFLNGQRKQAAGEGYCGGELNLYGLFKSPRGENIGFPLAGEEGLLIAFASDIIHEVAPITYGERYTIVSWFN